MHRLTFVDQNMAADSDGNPAMFRANKVSVCVRVCLVLGLLFHMWGSTALHVFLVHGVWKNNLGNLQVFPKQERERGHERGHERERERERERVAEKTDKLNMTTAEWNKWNGPAKMGLIAFDRQLDGPRAVRYGAVRQS